MRGKNDAKELTCDVIKVWESTTSQDGGHKTDLRSVAWCKGDKRYPSVEKREFYDSDGAGWKMGKAKGFNLHDLSILERNWPAVMRSMGSNLPEHSAAVAAGGKPAEAAPPAASRQEDF